MRRILQVITHFIQMTIFETQQELICWNAIYTWTLSQKDGIYVHFSVDELWITSHRCLCLKVCVEGKTCDPVAVTGVGLPVLCVAAPFNDDWSSSRVKESPVSQTYQSLSVHINVGHKQTAQDWLNCDESFVPPFCIHIHDLYFNNLVKDDKMVLYNKFHFTLLSQHNQAS